MFKDYDKYLTTSIKVYLFVLIIIFILKMVGLDYFGLDYSNKIIIYLDNLFIKYKYIKIMFYFSELMIYQYVMTSIIVNDNSKKFIKYTLITIPFTFVLHARIKGLLIKYNLSIIVELLYLFIICLIYKIINKNKEKITLPFIKVMFLNLLFQFISAATRYKYSINCINSITNDIILNIDYMIMLLISYNIFFMKGDVKLCGISQVEAGSFSLKKLNFKNLLKRLQKNWHNFRELDKVTKLTYIIYFILSLIWNTLSVVLILFVACLNDTLIECIFILTSFWLSKGKFGKAFHFSSMTKCFIVSNLSYYILNRITTPLGISILVPILLGVGLSYVTSKFVKKTYKPLYRGMPEELFEETILKVVDKDSLKYKICYDFYMNKKSIISLSMKYNYTEAGIRKIKDRVNDKIKRLN